MAAGQAVEIVEAGSDVLCVRRHENTGAHPDVGRSDKAVGGCDRHFVAEEELHHVVQGEGITGQAAERWRVERYLLAAGELSRIR